ncbi:MAG: hypothetical protein IT352_02750, partial [Gemmatimonadales bacterium]|nr:hypothetical protein [Gemmatimonadales bacterium]
MSLANLVPAHLRTLTAQVGSMTVRTARFVAPFLAALTSSSALAQGEATDSVLAAACRADAQIVNTQSPDSLVSGALLRLAYCDVSGPPAVAKFWSVNADSTKWSVVLQVTPYLRDKRILDTVLAIAGRTSASVGLRRLALVGLVGLFQPGRSVPWDVALDPALDSLGGTFASSAVITPLTGAVAYPSGYRATIATLVKDVSLGESNTQLQSLASYIRRRLYWLDPTSTPLAGTGSVGVTYLCGNRFRIQNRD